MTVPLKNINERYERCLVCVDAEFADMPAGSGGRVAADALAAAYAVIQQSRTSQAGFGNTAKAGTGERTAGRVGVKGYRTRVAETAVIIARKIPGFEQNFPFPSGETDEELIAETRAIVPKAVAAKAEFALRGLSLEFLESGTALVDAFDATFDTTNEALSHKGAASGSKKSAYREADEHFDELDIYIRNTYFDQPDKIHTWNIASKLERPSSNKTAENGENNGENEPAP